MERIYPMTNNVAYDEHQIREDVIRTARLMWERGYVTGTAGNVSARLGTTDKLVITPSDSPYASLKPEDLALCSVQCEHLAGAARPSVELPFHAAIYCARADVGAIVHTHSPHATAAACIGNAMPILLEEALGAIGSDRVPCAAFAPSGTTQLAEIAVAALGDEGKALLLAEHGTLAVGSNLEEAFAISEMIEKAAEAFILSGPGGEEPNDGGRSRDI
jgi:L-fuculose-phosphate aldolase